MRVVPIKGTNNDIIVGVQCNWFVDLMINVRNGKKNALKVLKRNIDVIEELQGDCIMTVTPVTGSHFFVAGQGWIKCIKFIFD